MSHYILIHGAWEESRAWNDVSPILKQAGHTVTAIDLPGHGENKQPISNVTMESYIQTVVEEINQLEHRVILVGHSMTGTVISQVAERIPEKIECLIYVAAFLLKAGGTVLETMQSDVEGEFYPEIVYSADQSYATAIRKKEMSKLKNKIAVVTGGNSGIGLATAKRFAAEGAKVIITGRRQEAVDEAVASIGAAASGIVADAAKLADTDRMIDQIQQEFGRIDVLFVNAGVAPMAPLAETDEASFDQVFGINVKGLFFTLQKALPLLNSGASVILNASVVQKVGFPGASAYAATKAAVRSIGQTAAAEFAPQGIRVNLLSPGPIETPIYGKTGLPQEAIDGMGEKFAASVPLGRFGTPDEMANVALFLASDESSYITGSDIQADGGLTQAFA